LSPPTPHPSYVVDTSVVLKWYVQRGESEVRKAFLLLEAYGQGQCVLRAPDLLPWEVANGLAIGRRLKPAEISEALVHLQGLDLDLHPLHWSTLQSAVEIASASDATVYDAYYLALALESGGVLVTADEKFLRKVRRYSGIVSLSQLQLPDLVP
jgi:predicted nucleic acid-binding protein